MGLRNRRGSVLLEALLLFAFFITILFFCEIELEKEKSIPIFKRWKGSSHGKY